MKTTNKLTIASKHGQAGLPVFPLAPNKKTPLISKEQGGNGCHDATTDEAQIRTWFTENPRANIGIAGGDGLIFIDVDAYKGANITDWNLPETRTVRTPSGGYHHYFFYDGLLPSRPENQLAPGVCIKAAGGYIVAPGSSINGRYYEWVDDRQPIADLPERIAEMIRRDDTKAPPPQARPGTNGHRPHASRDDSGNTGAYWLQRALEKAGDGAGDTTGYWLACQLLIAEKHGATVDTQGVLLDFAQQATLNPRDPFTERDVSRWIASANRSHLVQSGTPAHAANNASKSASSNSSTTDNSASESTGDSSDSDEQASSDNNEDAIPYEATPNGLVWKKPTSTRDGQVSQVTIPLANFTAQIVADITEDDGAETRRQFEIEAKLRGRISRFTVPADRFATMGWPVEHLGATAILYPGQSIKEHARTAIQMLSRDIPQRRTYTHTGWIMADDGPIYLHAGGAIGADGTRTDVSVALQGDLRGYELPEPPDGDALREAVRASLRVLELAPDSIVFPLHASIYLAPIAEADTSLYLAGQTGVGKSEVAALAQQHYGPAMDARHLPASWASSGNALEAQAFLAKDALMVIDDFIPTGSTADIQRQHRDADRVLRAQGNHSGRQRMRADTSLRPAKPPRGLILATGEDIPRGHSLRGRMFILEVEPEALRWERLAACQADARDGLYAQAMAGYLQWLAGQLDKRQVSQRAKLATFRDTAAASSAHRRTPEIVAKLAYGLNVFLEFALTVGAISRDEHALLWKRGWNALGEAAARQAQHQNASEPTRRFLELVNAALTAHIAHLATTSGEKPGTYEQSWGWQKITVGSGENMREEWRGQGERIGWLDGENVYLEPTATYTLIQKMARDGGDPLGVTLQVLQKRLKERRLLASTDEPRQTNTVRRKCEGRQHGVLHFTLQTLSHYIPPDKPDIETDYDEEVTANPLKLSGCDVGKSGISENPTRYPTQTKSDNFSLHAANVGNVGYFVGGESTGVLVDGDAAADVSAMSGDVPLSVQNPTSKPDIPISSSHRPTFEERVEAHMRRGMREDEAIRCEVSEGSNK